MLFDEVHEQLKNMEPDIKTITMFWNNSGREKRLDELAAISNQELFWQNPQQTDILKELQRLRLQKEHYDDITKSYQDLSELASFFKHEEQELKNIATDIKQLSRKVSSFKVELLLHDPQDNSDCFLSINAGAGGTESQDWADMLLRMFLRFCEREKLSTQLIDYQAGEGAGIKSATMLVQGKNAYGLLKGEAGVHRLVRISPFDANKRRHTSFSAVTVTPDIPDAAIVIDPKDLRIDTFRAGGAGGQHVNKTDSAVRITHFPSGIVVQCQNQRSQGQNKETAMKMLRAKLLQKQEAEKREAFAKIEKKKIEWGSQIRSYVLHPYKMVKDHRTDMESMQPDQVLDGELMKFIEAYLILLGKEE